MSMETLLIFPIYRPITSRHHLYTLYNNTCHYTIPIHIYIYVYIRIYIIGHDIYIYLLYTQNIYTLYTHHLYPKDLWKPHGKPPKIVLANRLQELDTLLPATWPGELNGRPERDHRCSWSLDGNPWMESICTMNHPKIHWVTAVTPWLDANIITHIWWFSPQKWGFHWQIGLHKQKP